ncbi:response regulator [Hymenobacter mucosus]|uniref:Response regulator receiver domain-containing protein n=2 Tax=Hymenobacter TaxID=89966 RepID=A0A238V4R0_9BACT|nr:response regulator [Hymenobacter mucosus]SNR29074.1 Response regulator receiver domain-containing protein [Hymenobacter mucosus]
MEKLPSILLVDDDKTTNFLNRLLLEDLQVAQQVLVAENGQEALHVIEQECQKTSCPPLILLDVNMPVMNGIEFLETYAPIKQAAEQSIVIVMLTTSLHPRDMARLESLPIQGFLNKPLTKQMVGEILQKHFKQELPT